MYPGQQVFHASPSPTALTASTTGMNTDRTVPSPEKTEPFYDYVYEHEDRTTYRKFKRYERSCFRWPKSFNEGTTVYIVTGKGIEEADYRNWRMPYYPMEWL